MRPFAIHSRDSLALVSIDFAGHFVELFVGDGWAVYHLGKIRWMVPVGSA